MTFHFAYPNVLPRSNIYIGCGRYAVFPPEKEPDIAYQEVLEAPMTPNRNLLARALQLLAVERYHSRNRLFHIQDQTEHIYQGDSLDLAWLLAQIHCSRNLCCPVNGDIWCTGILDLDKDGVHLLGVNHDAFCLKLEAFLDPANPDTLFIVPLANINSQTVAICEKRGAAIRQLDSCSRRLCKSNQKQVLAVPANGMIRLLEFLFIKKKITRTVAGGILLLTAIFLGCWFASPYLPTFFPETAVEKEHAEKNDTTGEEIITETLQPEAEQQTVVSEQQNRADIQKKEAPAQQSAKSSQQKTTPQQQQQQIPTTAQQQQPIPQNNTAPQKTSAQQIVAAIKRGDFQLLTAFLQADGHNENISQKERLLQQQIASPTTVKAQLRYQLANGKKGETIFTGEGVLPLFLTRMDYYRLVITIDSSAEKLWLYALQVDSLGKLSMLFPNAALGSTNPISKTERRVLIPESSAHWLVLDNLPENEKKQISENIYLLLSPWPAEDIEKLLPSLTEEPQNAAGLAILQQLKKREKIKIPALYYHYWSFSHVRPEQPFNGDKPVEQNQTAAHHNKE